MKLSGAWDTVLSYKMENIIFENRNFIVYNKPAGMLVQSERSFDVDLISRLKTYLTEKGERPDLFLINRLDRPVSGLVLLAKNKEFAGKLTSEMQKGEINKEYYAIVCGRPEPGKGIMEDFLVKDARNNMSRITHASQAGAKQARLEYQVLAEKTLSTGEGGGIISLVRIHLLTGRHHQIRVQFAGRNMPLLGDAKYGKEMGKGRESRCISLCSFKLDFLDKSFSIKPEGPGFEYFKEELETIYSQG